MRDPLHRLYQTKLALLATIFTVLGIALLVLVYWPGLLPETGWLAALPLSDLGSALFTTGLVVIAFEYVDGRDSEIRAEERLRAVLSAEAPAMRDAVIAGFAFEPDDLARVSSPATLDRIAENVLAIQLGNSELATDVYRNLRINVLRAGERWEDVRVTISLAPASEKAGRAPLFEATIHWEYKVVPSESVRRFACVSDPTEYAELSQEGAASRVWLFPEGNGLTARSREAFELLDIAVDGKPRPIRRAVRAKGQTYTASLGTAGEATGPVAISYTYRVLLEQHGHLVFIDFDQPSRDVSIELRYADCGIRHVNVLDFLASPGARVERRQAGGDSSVSVATDGWVVPRAGVAFVWALEREMSDRRSRPAT